MNNEITLLDLACGKGGDIAKWRGISTVVGIDISRDGIENMKDGAYERYFSSIHENKLYPESQKMYFLAGDSSKIISNGNSYQLIQFQLKEWISVSNQYFNSFDENCY